MKKKILNYLKFGSIVAIPAIIVGVSVGAFYGLTHKKHHSNEQTRTKALHTYYFDQNGVFFENKEQAKDAKFKIPVYVYKDVYEASTGISKEENDLRTENVVRQIIKEAFDPVISELGKGINFGPELSSITAIRINDNILTSGMERGVYLPLTREIGLNTSGMSEFFKEDGNTIFEKLFDALKTKLISDQNMTWKDFQDRMVADSIEPVLFHEYGHHMAAEYASSPYKESNALNFSTQTDSLKAIYNNKEENEWNKNFVKDFKHLLSYDKKSAPLVKSNHQELKSIGEYWSAKNAFDYANVKDSGYLFNKNVGNSYSMYKQQYYNNYYQLWQFQNDSNVLQYKYSMDELYTRKLVAAGSTYSTPSWFATKFLSVFNDLHHDKLTNAEDNQMQNFIHGTIREAAASSDFIYTNILPDKQILSQKDFMSDYVFGENGDKRAKDLATMVVKEIGAAVTNDPDVKQKQVKATPPVVSNISYITTDAGWESYSKSDDDQMKLSKEKGDGDIGSIRIGGMYNKKKDYNFIGYMDGNKFVSFPIVNSHVNIGYKDIANSSTKNILTQGIKSYWTEDYIKGESIVDKKLYFSGKEDGSDKVKMHTIRDNDYGIASNYLEEMGGSVNGSESDENIFVAKKDSNGVTISKGETWREREESFKENSSK